MNLILYFVVMAVAMLGLSRVLFVLTLPLTILTLGLFLLVLNALMLWLTAKLVPGFSVHGFGTTLIASLILAAVGMAWKAFTAAA
jgi:putative membrane protein